MADCAVKKGPGALNGFLSGYMEPLVKNESKNVLCGRLFGPSHMYLTNHIIAFASVM
jgi:hypothetical protein